MSNMQLNQIPNQWCRTDLLLLGNLGCIYVIWYSGNRFSEMPYICDLIRFRFRLYSYFNAPPERLSDFKRSAIKLFTAAYFIAAGKKEPEPRQNEIKIKLTERRPRPTAIVYKSEFYARSRYHGRVRNAKRNQQRGYFINISKYTYDTFVETGNQRGIMKR